MSQDIFSQPKSLNDVITASLMLGPMDKLPERAHVQIGAFLLRAFVNRCALDQREETPEILASLFDDLYPGVFVYPALKEAFDTRNPDRAALFNEYYFDLRNSPKT